VTNGWCMRQWWQDLAIGTGSTLIAASVIAVAGKAAHLFDQAEFDLGRFLGALGSVATAIAVAATLIDAAIRAFR
jgi:hypothetical protein